MEEQVIKDLIQEAWNEGDNNTEDRFGDFLNRAAHKVCGSLSPKGEKPGLLTDEEIRGIGRLYIGKIGANRQQKKMDNVELGLFVKDIRLLINKAVEQAKAEVAREIIEIAKREVKYAMRQELYKMPSPKQQDAVAHNLGSRLEESLKDNKLPNTGKIIPKKGKMK